MGLGHWAKRIRVARGGHVSKHPLLPTFLRVLWNMGPPAEGSSLPPAGSRKLRLLGQVLTSGVNPVLTASGGARA